jgi:ABC-type dipeptide/oligopeptide/nickel transport system permease component
MWRSIALMSVARSRHAAVRLPDGRVLVVGGTDSSNHGLRLAEVFDPRTDSWKPVRSMAVARAYPGAQLLADGRVIVFGGSDSGVLYASAEIYDPANDVWSAAPDMPIATDGLSSVRLANGQIVVIAGRQLEVYNPAGVPGGSPRPRLPIQLPGFSKGVFSSWLLVATLAMLLGLGLLLAAGVRPGWSPARGLGSAGLQVGGVVMTAMLLLIVAGKDVAYAPLPGSGQPAEYWFLSRPVGQEVIDASLLSLQLMAMAAAWSSLAGLVGAIWVTSWRRRRLFWLDLFAALIWIAPTFLIAILVQEIQAAIAGHTGLVIAAGFGAVNPVQVIWAAVVLGIRPMAYFYRHGRSILERESSLDYARTAESKGLDWSRVVRRHLLRAGGSSLISTWLNSFRLMIGSLCLVEYFFGYPGLGRVLALSLGVPQGGRVSVHPDLALGLVLVLAATLVAAEQSAGWLRLRLDPRLREPVVVR